MPKPFSNRPGNGMHMHMSIGESAPGGRRTCSRTSRTSTVSICRSWPTTSSAACWHAPALAALCAPTVNSYKRLVVGRSLTGATWAPAYISYGDNNRSSMVRIPGGRLELRLPDGACNPYLATAA
jgi:glutamine synthetase